jgi:hypothetical protein
MIPTLKQAVQREGAKDTKAGEQVRDILFVFASFVPSC